MKKRYIFLILIIISFVFSNVYALSNGWISKKASRFYVVNNVYLKGKQKIDNDYYIFNEETGRLYTSTWVTLRDKSTYYSTASGKIVMGWQKISNNKYYFGENGVYKGIQSVDGKLYFFNYANGKLLSTGWVSSTNGKKYYVNEDGTLKIGWFENNKSKYYFGSDGVLVKGIQTIDSVKYAFNSNSGSLLRDTFFYMNNDKYYINDEGKVYSGFKTFDNSTFYFDSDGKMVKGINNIDGNHYYFDKDGIMSISKWLTISKKIYYAGEDGKFLVGNQIVDGDPYNFDLSGELATGWQTINNKKYYFYADGTKAKYICKIAGKRYEFSSKGELQHSDIKLILDVSAYQGDVDWNKLWKSKSVDGVILRISAGCEKEDKMLSTYVKKIKELKIPYGFYIYSYAENYNEGKLYANFMKKTMDKYEMNSPTLGIYLDLEANSITNYMGTKEYTQVVKGFLSVLPNAKLYTYLYYSTTALNTDYLHSYIDWIAQYANSCSYKYSYRGWQYTSSGSVPGISGKVDLSIFYS